MAHLNLFDRVKISCRIRDGYTQSAIAKELGCAPSTICREIRRNRLSSRRYDAAEADRKAKDRRSSRCVEAKLEQKVVYEAVAGKLELKWSPQQISGWLAGREDQATISHQTIYRYLWSLPRNHLHRRAMRRKGRRPRQAKPGFITRAIKERVSIHERAQVVNDRGRIGDWELDLMTCHATSGYLITAVERKTGYTLIRKVRSKHTHLVIKGILQMFKAIPRSKIKTFTFDNGNEFYAHRRLSRDLGVKVYFADPYNSGQRGTNENTNGLIRQYFPRTLGYDQISYWDVKKAQCELNGRPRLRLHFQTPADLFE